MSGYPKSFILLKMFIKLKVLAHSIFSGNFLSDHSRACLIYAIPCKETISLCILTGIFCLFLNLDLCVSLNSICIVQVFSVLTCCFIIVLDVNVVYFPSISRMEMPSSTNRNQQLDGNANLMQMKWWVARTLGSATSRLTKVQLCHQTWFCYHLVVKLP